jgi:hypothetical protein
MEGRKMKIGMIKFGKSRPAPKAVIVDVFYDNKTGAALFKVGLELLKKDKEAVIEYAIQKALAYNLKK